MKKEFVNQMKVGNIFYDIELKQERKITSIDIYNESVSTKSFFLPVELTEERLPELGFEKETELNYNHIYTQKEYVNCCRIRIQKYDGHFQWTPNMWSRVNLKYIHQLQNLFMVLNETELIKE